MFIPCFFLWIWRPRNDVDRGGSREMKSSDYKNEFQYVDHNNTTWQKQTSFIILIFFSTKYLIIIMTYYRLTGINSGSLMNKESSSCCVSQPNGFLIFATVSNLYIYPLLLYLGEIQSDLFAFDCSGRK